MQFFILEPVGEIILYTRNGKKDQKMINVVFFRIHNKYVVYRSVYDDKGNRIEFLCEREFKFLSCSIEEFD